MSHPLCFDIGLCEEGKEHLFDEKVSAHFLELEGDDEISCDGDVSVSGRLYRVSDEMIVHGSIETTIQTRCSLCNEQVTLPIVIKKWEHQTPLEELKKGVWDLRDAIRESILLEVPYFVQCGGIECHNEDEVRKYLAKDKEATHQPFQSML